MNDNLKFETTDFTTDNTVEGLPNNPSAPNSTFTAETLKQRFDYIGRYMIALGKHNALVDALSATTAAAGIGAVVHLDGFYVYTVQDALTELASSASSADTRLDALEALGLSVVNNQICITY